MAVRSASEQWPPWTRNREVLNDEYLVRGSVLGTQLASPLV